MTIHTVSAGETIHSISEQYGVPESRIVADNALGTISKLLVGRALLISRPQCTYVVRGGDTLQSIADRYGVSTLSLLQNNSHIGNGRLLPSQILNVSFEKEYEKPIIVSAYTEAASAAQIESCLPHITYLHIQNAVFLQNGNVSLLENAVPLVSLAKQYHAESILVVECKNDYENRGSRRLAELLASPGATERFIHTLTAVAEKNGFAGLEIQCFCAEPAVQARMNEMVLALDGVCKEKGLLLSLPKLPGAQGFPYDFGSISPLWSYVWDDAGTRSPAAPLNKMKEVLAETPHDFKEKTLLGIPAFAVEYGSNGKRALQVSVLPEIGTVQFDAITQTPQVYCSAKRETRELLCFEDARSYAGKLALVKEFGLGGINVMSLAYDAPILWKVLNQNFTVQKIRKIC